MFNLTFRGKVTSFGKTWSSALKDLGSFSSHNHFWSKQRYQHRQATKSNCHNGIAGITKAQ